MRHLLILLIATLASLKVAADPVYDKLEAQYLYWPDVGKAAHEPRGKVIDVWTTTSDHVRLHGWWLPGPPGAPTILFLHGNGGSLPSLIPVFEGLRDQKLNVLAFDYRGYGESQGHPSEQGLYRDALAAYDYALRQRHIPISNLVIYGHSLGGAVACYLVSKKPCAGWILESTFDCLESVVSLHQNSLAPIARGHFASNKIIQATKAPLLDMHGGLDPLIPFWLGLALYKAAPAPKEWWLMPLAHHGDIWAVEGEKFFTKVAKFAQRVTHHKTIRRTLS